MIRSSARDYLKNHGQVRVAHLVEVELSGQVGVFNYLTDYRTDLTVDGITYKAGKVTDVGDVRLTQGLTNYEVSVTIAGEYDEEMEDAASDESYEGRVLNIYRAYLDEKGDIIDMQEGEKALVLFKGEIVNIDISDPVISGSIEIVWECAGELQDFETVNGRLLDDSDHRGLVSSGDGSSSPSNAAFKEAYKTDTGFLHANQTINTSVTYLTTETDYEYTSSWLGLRGTLREREVEVKRKIDIKVSLEAKHLPVIYGVRKVQGVPVFADSLADSPDRMVVVYAVCEGEISGFLNAYVDGASVICGPGAQSQDSGICVGNMARGDTLGTYASSNRINYIDNKRSVYPYPPDSGYGRKQEEQMQMSSFGTLNEIDQRSTEGTNHGDSYQVLADKGPIIMTFYHGKPDQKPDEYLVETAKNNGFLLQRNRRKPDGTTWGPEYWADADEENGVSGAALLDTAYVICEFALSEDRDEIPEIEFVVDGVDGLILNPDGTAQRGRTINPVWQLCEYLTNNRYGPGLGLDRLIAEDWIFTAQKQEIADTSYSPEYIANWRYVGWLGPEGVNYTMQCNTLIDTSNSTTDEVEGLLNQFRGSLVPWRGYFSLSVENNDDPVVEIDPGEVIGSVNIENKANRDKWNSISATIQNPDQNWGGTQINFFNSQYLEEDKGIKKQGRAVFEHITNYYTARSWAQYILNDSRFGKTVKFTTYFKYFFLKPNDNVLFTYSRYGFTEGNNLFRVIEVVDKANGEVELTLAKFTEDAFDKELASNDSDGASEGEEVLRPQSVSFTELPASGINISTPSGVFCGLLQWDYESDNQILRYNVVGFGDEIQVPNNQTIEIAGDTKNYALLEGISPNMDYILKVQAVYKSGKKSPFTILNVQTGDMDPASLDPIENFRVVNEELGQFVGPDLELEWDSANVDEYEVQIRLPDSSTVIHSETVTDNNYTFTLSQNMSAYNSTEGGIGAYRSLSPRVRAKQGNTVSEWSNL